MSHCVAARCTAWQHAAWQHAAPCWPFAPFIPLFNLVLRRNLWRAWRVWRLHFKYVRCVRLASHSCRPGSAFLLLSCSARRSVVALDTCRLSTRLIQRIARRYIGLGAGKVKPGTTASKDMRSTAQHNRVSGTHASRSRSFAAYSYSRDLSASPRAADASFPSVAGRLLACVPSRGAVR